MTADLRAALREALQMAADALPLIPESSVREQFARLVALADAPPTVAELLPLVDATHEVHWIDRNGHERIVSDVDYTVDMRPADFGQPATLVEVTP